VILCLLLGQERAGALEHVLNAQLAPGQELRVAVVEQRNTLAGDDQSRVFAIFKINSTNLSGKLSLVIDCAPSTGKNVVALFPDLL